MGSVTRKLSNLPVSVSTRMALGAEDQYMTLMSRTGGLVMYLQLGSSGPLVKPTHGYSSSTVYLGPMTAGHVHKVGVAVAGLEMRLSGSARSHWMHDVAVR